MTPWTRLIPLGAVVACALAGCGTTDDTAHPVTTTAAATTSPDTAAEEPGSTATTGQTTAGQPSASTGATQVVTLVAIDATGNPINGFTLPDPQPVGSLDCTTGDPSRSAPAGGIYHCGASADSADVCWPMPSRTELRCADDPWQRRLRSYTVDPPLQPIGTTSKPEPWGLELADGTQCRIRVGGAWGGRSDGLVGAYSCTGTSDVVLQPPNAPSAVDTSGPTWQIRMGPLGSGNPDFPPPAVVAVRTAYFAAAS
ncbi:hypothetical protein NONO_c64840 [Nocardia nova SH22a]|uniref:Secreted protein n=1 Tax=Nocardia nova SH22a TaxID=1415166 RepID=W5TQ18_9NOCA|nr:hypothetical protein [Nocardia nova]AHH21254.1 hypothetical protein NONO_c64840 [Nocardia nova SH22a]